MRAQLDSLDATHPAAAIARTAAREATGLLGEATQALLGMLGAHPERAQGVAVPYLMLCGFVMGGWLMARAAAVAAAKLGGSERAFYLGKLATAQFYAEQVLPRALGLHRIVAQGAASTTLDPGLI